MLRVLIQRSGRKISDLANSDALSAFITLRWGPTPSARKALLLSPQRNQSAFGIQHSAFSIQHSAFD
jgi:hypothetical protein